MSELFNYINKRCSNCCYAKPYKNRIGKNESRCYLHNQDTKTFHQCDQWEPSAQLCKDEARKHYFTNSMRIARLWRTKGHAAEKLSREWS